MSPNGYLEAGHPNRCTFLKSKRKNLRARYALSLWGFAVATAAASPPSLGSVFPFPFSLWLIFHFHPLGLKNHSHFIPVTYFSLLSVFYDLLLTYFDDLLPQSCLLLRLCSSTGNLSRKEQGPQRVLLKFPPLTRERANSVIMLAPQQC